MVVNRGVFVGMSNNPASLDFGEQEKCVNKRLVRTSAVCSQILT